MGCEWSGGVGGRVVRGEWSGGVGGRGVRGVSGAEGWRL